jgi:hypothetical protein
MILSRRRQTRRRYPDMIVVPADGNTEVGSPCDPTRQRWRSDPPARTGPARARQNPKSGGGSLEAKVVWGETDIKSIVTRVPRVRPDVPPDPNANRTSGEPLEHHG